MCPAINAIVDHISTQDPSEETSFHDEQKGDMQNTKEKLCKSSEIDRDGTECNRTKPQNCLHVEQNHLMVKFQSIKTKQMQNYDTKPIIRNHCPCPID